MKKLLTLLVVLAATCLVNSVQAEQATQTPAAPAAAAQPAQTPAAPAATPQPAPAPAAAAQAVQKTAAPAAAQQPAQAPAAPAATPQVAQPAPAAVDAVVDLKKAVADEPASLTQRLWNLVGVFHPAVVHFPVAMLTVAALFVLLGWKIRSISPDVAFYSLLIGAASTVPASLMGWAFAAQRGYGNLSGTEADFHRWGGIAVTLLAMVFAAIALRDRVKPSPALRRTWNLGVLVSAGIVGLVGHWGGSLTYGEDLYANALDKVLGNQQVAVEAVESGGAAVETAPNNGKPAVLNAAVGGGNAAAVQMPESAPEFFVKYVKPILEGHCVQCHGQEKAKGKYRMHTRDEALAKDESGAPRIIPGDSKKSKLCELLKAQDKEDMMPPEEISKLTEKDIAVLYKWIDDGAIWPTGLELKTAKK